MQTIYDSTRKVKPATRRPFALGVARPNRERRAPFTASDAAWWTQNAPSNRTGFEVLGLADSRWDALAADSLAQSRVDAGCVAC